MNRNFIFVFLSVLALPSLLASKPGKEVFRQGSFLQPLQKRDSVLIADQLKYGFRISNVEEGTRLMPPEWRNEGFCEGVELVSDWTNDTLKRYKASKDGSKPASYDIESSVVITSFDEGTYDLPAIKLGRWHPDGVVDTLEFDPQSLTVTAMPVDTATFRIHDIKGQIRYPLTAQELVPYVLAVQILALIVATVVCIVLIRKRKEIYAKLHAEPAHIVALRKLDHYRGDKFWEGDKQKLFYSGVTDALREYIASRYDVSAMEMTTADIMKGLDGKDIPSDLYKELQALFETADFVKFAKMTAGREENASVIPVAVRFVTETYQTEIQEENKEEEA